MNQYINRVKTMISSLEKARYEEVNEDVVIYKKSIGYNQREIMLEKISEEGWEIFQNGSSWGGREKHDCFKVLVKIPSAMAGEEIWAKLNTGAVDIWNTDNPQFLVYLEGKIICGMDMNHHEVCLTKTAQGEESLELGLYAYSNSDSAQDYFRILICKKNPEVEQLYYDCKVLFDIAMEQREESIPKIEIIDLLNQVANQLEFRFGIEENFLKSVAKTRKMVQEYITEKSKLETDVTVHSIGHTHIDVAWKWPLRQTREKVVRSFATVLQLMKDYEEYRFMSSQPQLYEFVKEEAPEIYQQIKEKIQENRWEPEGSMWVEPDCNLTSGESLVRQILYGKAFFKEEFNKGDDKVLWLPDVFGYSAALPQILKKAGIEYFMTTKINWNEYNKFPNDVMYWTGIDGTEILTYFISTTNHQAYPELILNKRHETTYNGRQNVSQVMGTWQRFSNKELSRDVLTCYGYGDGGGGPTSQMLEENRRMQNGLFNCPKTKQTFAKEFFDILNDNLENKKVPRWNGELYLEFHRGTYTSMAKNKKYNRRCEFLNSDVEFFSVLAELEGNHFKYPKAELDKIWKMTLLNQFHDILPGSSIEDVYEDSTAQYESIIKQDHELINRALESCGQQMVSTETTLETASDSMKAGYYIFYNTTGMRRSSYVAFTQEQYKELVKLGYCGKKQILSDASVYIKLPEIAPKAHITSKYLINTMNLETVDSTEEKLGNYSENSEGYLLETCYYKVWFNHQGEIYALFDKEEDRYVGKENQILNQFIAFEDKPFEYDAWNIDSYYEEKSWKISELKSIKVKENGPLLCSVQIERVFMNSTIVQEICFYHDKKRIDFKTNIDWKEEQILLKAAFPIDVQTNKIVCDIQFGNVERATHKNTSWDQAKFEVCAHKWVDLAEHGYGVALLNDCKYGLDVQDTTIRLTLLKSGIFPFPDADKEMHEFTYSLLPHRGDFREGKVVEESFELNVPLYCAYSKGEAPLKESGALLTTNCENVVLETLKKAEKGSDIIVRMYECYGKRSKVSCDLKGLGAKQVILCNLLEEEVVNQDKKEMLHFENGRADFMIKPYEIITLKIKK